MKYVSTRDKLCSVTASQAILSGLSPDGGLFLPKELPRLSIDDIVKLCKLSYAERAAEIISRFLTDFSYDELFEYAKAAYSYEKFGSKAAPVVKHDGAYILELFHGPTCAFKDFALQLLPYLLTASLRKNNITKDIAILTATSGDTGKAALEGFADVAGTKICVFYPDGGTSRIQRLQMTTQNGGNVMVSAVYGNFDDAQSGVKSIFTDREFNRELNDSGIMLSSANSINWGRLVPQIVYYFSSYCDLVDSGEITAGDSINVTVPTGNFGNILASYLAKLCGLPIKRFICASNINNVLTDFINTGVYDKNRPFKKTTSPSMDILISSNLERLLFILSGYDDAVVRGYMKELSECGKYTVGDGMMTALQSQFAAGYAEDSEAAEIIKKVFEAENYLVDPHTAVALSVYEKYRSETGDEAPTIIASTASPFKFPKSVMEALGYGDNSDDFTMIRNLEKISSLKAPIQLTELENKAERFTETVKPTDMRTVVEKLRNI